VGTLSGRLKQTLQKLGVNQQEFAKKIGFTQSYISKILNGTKIPSSRFFDVVSHELYLNPQWLQNGTGDMFLSASGFSPEDAAMVAKYRLLTTEEKSIIDKMTDVLLKKKEPSFHIISKSIPLQ
jgi:transcriptional regulator with XRE-family HTH domain